MKKKYSSLRSVSPLTNSIFKSVIIKNKSRIFSLIFRSFNLDRINYPRQKYQKTYIPNGYIDIIKTKLILKGRLHGNRVMCYVNKKFVSDIDNLNDLKIANCHHTYKYKKI